MGLVPTKESGKRIQKRLYCLRHEVKCFTGLCQFPCSKLIVPNKRFIKLSTGAYRNAFTTCLITSSGEGCGYFGGIEQPFPGSRFATLFVPREHILTPEAE